MHLLKVLSVSSILLLLTVSCGTLQTKKDMSIEYFNLANDLFDMKNYEKAIELYQKALTYNKSNKDALLNLIISYQNSAKYQDAETLIFREYTHGTSDYDKKLMLLLGKNYYLTANYAKAAALYEDFINAFPDEKIGYFNLGLTHLKLGNSNEAINNFINAYNKDNTFTPALFNISNYYFLNKQYEESIPYITALVKQESSNDKILFMYAKILFMLGEYETCRETIKKCVDIDSDNKDYLLFTARVYAKGFDDKKNTFTYIEKALEKGTLTSDLSSVTEFNSLRENYKTEYSDLIKKYMTIKK